MTPAGSGAATALTCSPVPGSAARSPSTSTRPRRNHRPNAGLALSPVVVVHAGWSVLFGSGAGCEGREDRGGTRQDGAGRLRYSSGGTPTSAVKLFTKWDWSA